jgi:hypothetical protein
MKTTKILFVLTLWSVICKTVAAQQRDSLTTKVIAAVAGKFANARALNFEFSGAGPYNFSSELQGKAISSGRVTNWSQIRVSATVNFIQTRKWILGANFAYRCTSVTATLDEPVAGMKSSLEGDVQYHTSSLNLTRIAEVFGKTTIISGSVSIDGSEKQFERTKGLFTTTMLLKANGKNRLGVGFMINIDPSAQLPALPIFLLEHHFNNGLIADITLPRNIHIRKHVLKYGRISIGTELDRTGFYLYNLDNSGRTFEYNQVDVNSGLTYEHLVFNYFIVTMKGGMRASLSPRIFDRNKSYGDPIFQTKPDPSAFFNLGFSFNPFAKKIK